MTTLTGPRIEAKSGTADSLIVFVHGYGADGNDLIGLGTVLKDHLPNTVFLSPNAPHPCTMNPMGKQWFPIPRLDGSSEEASREGFLTVAQTLDTYLSEVMAAEGIPAKRTFLVGFSQGTMMSLHVGPRRADALGGIVGFSGRLLAPELLGEVKTKPPVLLVHGDMDDVLPIQHLPEAADALVKADFEVYTHVSKGMAHGIGNDGLSLALQFIQQQLNPQPDAH